MKDKYSEDSLKFYREWAEKVLEDKSNNSTIKDSDNIDKSSESKTASNEKPKENQNLEKILVTDKEFLIISNISNLRLEFAKLTEEIIKNENGTIKKEIKNHTIHSLLSEERTGLKVIEKGGKAPVVFYNYDTDDEKKPETPLHKSVIDLKKTSGITYEYFEKDDPILKDWEILHASDGYGEVTKYIDFIYGAPSYKYVTKGSLRNFLYLLHKGDSKKIAADIALIISPILSDNTNDSNTENSEARELDGEGVAGKLLSFELNLEEEKLDIKDGIYGDEIILPKSIIDKLFTFFKERIKKQKIDEKGLYDSRKKNVEKLRNLVERRKKMN